MLSGNKDFASILKNIKAGSSLSALQSIAGQLKTLAATSNKADILKLYDKTETTSKVETIEVRAEDVKVFSGITANQITQIIEKTKYKLVRGLVTRDGKELFIWNASLATHEEIASAIGVTFGNAAAIYIELKQGFYQIYTEDDAFDKVVFDNRTSPALKALWLNSKFRFVASNGHQYTGATGSKDAVAVTADKITVEEDKINDLAESLEQQIDELKEGLNYFLDILLVYQKDNDKILPDIKSTIEASVYDYATATDATYEYDRQWFQRALLSESAKVELAGFLVSLISKYTKSNLDTLIQIMNYDSDIMDMIRFPDLDL